MAAQKPAKPKPIYSVDEYDPTRDPAADLVATLRTLREQPTPRRILLLMGGNNCSWCVRLERYIVENEQVASILHDNYIVMKVNASAENEGFIEKFPNAGGGVPQFHVLNEEGIHIHAQSTADLEDGDTYNGLAMLNFLNRWKPGIAAEAGEGT